MQHLITLLDTLKRHEVDFVSLKDSGIDTTTATGTLMLQILAAFSEYERNIIRERTRSGLARARRTGKTFGRPRVELDLRAAHALRAQGHSVRAVADMLAVPRGTLARRLKEAEQGGSKRGGCSDPVVSGLRPGPQRCGRKRLRIGGLWAGVGAGDLVE